MRVLIVLVTALSTILVKSIAAGAAPDPAEVDESASGNTTILTTSLAVVAPQGTAAVEAWIRFSGSLEAIEEIVSEEGQIRVRDLLMLWDGDFDSIDLEESRTTTGITSLIDADIDNQSGGGPKEDYEVILEPELGSWAIDPVTVGRLSVVRESRGVYSAVGYIDMGMAPPSFLYSGASGSSGSGLQPGSSESTQASASYGGPILSFNYLVWPTVARLGETVAVLLETKTEIDFYPDGLDVDIEKFSIQLTAGFFPPTGSVTPRAAIEAPAALGSLLAGSAAESWTGILLFFDLPDPWPPLPEAPIDDDTTLVVRVDYDGIPIFDNRTVQITTNGGSPLSAEEFKPVSELQMQPMLRLRPSFDPSEIPAVGFYPNWQIGALEFILRYQKPTSGGDIANLAVRANAEATTAVVMVEPLIDTASEKTWRISVVDPKGFTIPEKGCVVAGDCYAGQWSLLDLTLTKLPEELGVGQSVFSPDDFEIEDLAAVDVDGDPLFPISSADTYFKMHAINNLVEPSVGSVPDPPNYVIWPIAAKTGQTVAAFFNTEDEIVDSTAAFLDASIDNVEIEITDPLGQPVSVQPSAVFEVPAAFGSKKVGSPPSSRTGVVAFFTIPDPWPKPGVVYNPDPVFNIEVLYNGGSTLGGNDIRIIGTGGEEFDSSTVAWADDLVLGPMLRLRPAWDAGDGFAPDWVIGGLEFTLRYTPPLSGGSVSNLTALGKGEAIDALVTLAKLPDDEGDKLWRIVALHPQGFTLPFKGCDPSPPYDCYSGRWSLLDFPLEKDQTGVTEGQPVFEPGHFSVESLRVFDLSGNLYTSSPDGEPFFHKYAVNNLALPVPEPDALIQLVFGSLLLGALNRFRHRNTLQ